MLLWNSPSFKLLILCLPTVAVAALVSYTLWQRRTNTRRRREEENTQSSNSQPAPISPQPSPDSSSQNKEKEESGGGPTTTTTNTTNTLDITVSPIQSQNTTNNTTTYQSDSGYTEQSTPLREDVLENVESKSTSLSSSVVLQSSSLETNKQLPIDTVAIRGGRARATVYLPLDIVGRFIGRQGRNIKSLMAESGAQIHVQQKNISKESSMVPCIVQGTQEQISTAVDLIVLRHPEVPFPTQYSSFPSLYNTTSINGLEGKTNLDGETEKNTTSSWEYVLEAPVRPSGVFPAIVTYIERLDRVWLVPYTSTQLLEDLHQHMTKSYSSLSLSEKDDSEKPNSEFSIVGNFCSVRVSKEYWLRGKVMKESEEKSSTYEVQLMDYGSSVIVPLSSVKPLKKEHTLLKMQAFPCQLANVEPNTSNSEDGMLVLQALVEGTVLEVHTSSCPVGGDEEESDLPVVELYIPSHYGGSEGQAFINRELVNQGFATWRESLKTTPIGQQATPTLTTSINDNKLSDVTNTNSPLVEAVASLPVLELLSIKKETEGTTNKLPLINSICEQQQKQDENDENKFLLNLLTEVPSTPPSLTVTQ